MSERPNIPKDLNVSGTCGFTSPSRLCPCSARFLKRALCVPNGFTGRARARMTENLAKSKERYAKVRKAARPGRNEQKLQARGKLRCHERFGASWGCAPEIDFCSRTMARAYELRRCEKRVLLQSTWESAIQESERARRRYRSGCVNYGDMTKNDDCDRHKRHCGALGWYGTKADTR